MSGRPQIETVIALTDVVAISVRRDQYPELIEKNTPVAMKIIRTFANKMRNMNDVLTKITLKSNIIASPEVAAIVNIDYDHMTFLGNTLNVPSSAIVSKSFNL